MFLDSSVELHEAIKLPTPWRVRPRPAARPSFVCENWQAKQQPLSLILICAGENSILS
jgi:hypothetical protein